MGLTTFCRQLTARERFGTANGSAQLRAKVVPSVEADRLTCPICLMVLAVPVFLPSCGTKPRHTFCLSCIDQWVSMACGRGDRPTCPLDRRQLDVDECFVLNEEAEEAVKVLPCRCPYSTFGCEQIPPLVEMEVRAISAARLLLFFLPIVPLERAARACGVSRPTSSIVRS
jgi:hypothetical protein